MLKKSLGGKSRVLTATLLSMLLITTLAGTLFFRNGAKSVIDEKKQFGSSDILTVGETSESVAEQTPENQTSIIYSSDENETGSNDAVIDNNSSGQSVSIPLEIKDPLKILDYPSGFSLFPGETVTFDITVQNLASVTYFVEFDFRLNDTEYQAKYVAFSNHNYSIQPGKQKLSAWITIAPTAPPANLIITIERKTDTPSPKPSPIPDSDMPLVQLLGGGARWAARNGSSALYVSWKDNWAAHHLTDGVDWQWFSESAMDMWRSRITSALTQSGFEVTFSGDIPDNIGDYDLVVIFAYYAAEPHLAELIQDYVSNGGGVILMAGVPCYFTDYSKVLSTGTNLTTIHEWLGCSRYANSGGSAHLAFDNPFGTSLSTNDILPFITPTGDILTTASPSHAGVTSLNEDSQPVAFWSTGVVFAFKHEYGYGRVYYQAIV